MVGDLGFLPELKEINLSFNKIQSIEFPFKMPKLKLLFLGI